MADQRKDCGCVTKTYFTTSLRWCNSQSIFTSSHVLAQNPSIPGPLQNENMRILMFTGKGGVGKTSLSAATGLKLAELNYRTLVMSIEAFGNAYRLSDANWNKLRRCNFYNPWQHRSEITGSKLMMFHAKDDPNVPYERTREFAEITGAKLKSLSRGGHAMSSGSIGLKSKSSSIRLAIEKHSGLSRCWAAS